MVYDFLVIGATGIQGRIATKDLLQSGYTVLMAGREKYLVDDMLKKYSKTNFTYLDLRNKSRIIKIIKKSGSNVVVNCADGNFNLDVMKACIRARVNYLDLGSDDWMTNEQLNLNTIMKKKDLLAITGCGSTPGISSVMAGHISGKFDRINKIYGGFAWNANMEVFVVPYSISTIVDEFVSQAPMIKNGKKKLVKPLSIELKHHLVNIGTQISKNILHQEVFTFYDSFKNKGIKDIVYFCAFPEFSFNIIMMLIKLGLGSNEKIIEEGKKIKIVDFIADVLRNIKIPKGYKEKEDIWVKLYGKKNGKKKMIEMVCTAGTLKGWEDATCNVDTGMPISIMAQMIKRNEIKTKGSFPPELIVPSNIFFEELAKRKMYIYENGNKINKN